jgi:PDZ domain
MQAAPPTPNRYGGPLSGGPPPPPQQAPPMAPPTPNPYGYGAPPPVTADPFAAAYGGPPPQQQQPPPPSTYGAPPPPMSDPFGGYGAPAPAPQALAMAPANEDPFGGYGAPPPQQQQQQQPPYGGYSGPPPPAPGGYGGPPPPAQIGYGDPFGGGGQPDYGGALVVSQQQSNPYAMPMVHQQQPPPPAAVDPFSVFNQAPAPPPPPQQQQQQQSYAMVPAHQPPQMVQASASSSGDVWGDLGFDAPPDQQAGAMVVAQPGAGAGPGPGEDKDNGELPPGGEYYDARIFTPTLGVMFFKPQELTDSLFLNTDRDVVDALGERPVVAFIVEGSSARSAGVELGHVLLKVNGVDVTNPKDASRLIKEGPRPLPLLFYVPNTEIVVAEGEHMVKYDTRETTAPNSAKDWKPKYVVIGGIIAQPWMINMYRSKSEYDIAVIETQARRPVSVKVKQFSLQGARIQNDWQGPQMVKYKNKLHPWKYIVVLPVARNPIKISSPNLASLKPVHEGIRRVLLAQQRSGRGGNPHSAAPLQQQDQGYNGHQDNEQQQQHYSSGGGGGGGPSYGQQQQAPPPQNYGAPPPQQNYGQAYGQPTAYGGY